MRVPYFYIIRHIGSGKRYVGSSWGKKTNPSQLLKEDGYTTSSKYVNKIIESEGISSFQIEVIITEEELQIPFNDHRTVLEYETWFQNFNDCAGSPDWFNKRNNNLKNHNYALYDNEVRIRHKEIMNDPVLREKIKRLALERYGVDHHAKTLESRKKMSEYWLSIDSNPYELCDKEKHKEIMNDPILWEKIRKGWLDRYGGHPMQNKEIKQRSVESNRRKFGVDNHSQTEEFRTFMSDNNPMYDRNKALNHIHSMKTTGSKISSALQEVQKVECPHCGKTGKGMGAMYQWHFDRCRSNSKSGLIRKKKYSKIDVIDKEGNVSQITKEDLNSQKAIYGEFKDDWKYVRLNSGFGKRRDR